MLVAVWRKKTCFIQFSPKIIALDFRGNLFGPPSMYFLNITFCIIIIIIIIITIIIVAIMPRF